KRVGKHHLHASRPVGAVKAEARETAVKLAIRIGPAAACKYTRLKVHTRQIRPRQDVLLCASSVDGGLARLREGMRGRWGAGRVRRKQIDERRRIDRDGASRYTQ